MPVTTAPYEVSEERVRAFVESTGADYRADAPLPPTFPIVVVFQAMNDFLAASGMELKRIIHGEQRFAYERPIAVGDVLVASFEETGRRTLAGNDVITAEAAVTDGSGALVCTARSTLIHRGGEDA